MKSLNKIVFGSIILILLSTGTVTASDVNGNSETVSKKYQPPSTIARLCFFPYTWNWPERTNVNGLNIGLANSLPQEFHLNGLDLAWFFCMTDSVSGMQLSFLNMTNYSSGMQLGVGNMFSNSGGFQMGLFFNYADNSDGMQLSIVNYAEEDSVQFQVGLINYLENGFLPWFPLFNFSN